MEDAQRGVMIDGGDTAEVTCLLANNVCFRGVFLWYSMVFVKTRCW